MTITEFVAAEVAKPFAWGDTDCASTADRWVQHVRGISPMAVYGRKHTNRDEALAWLAEPGGVSVAFNRIMRAAGFEKTTDPQPGDLGLVLFGPRACVAIHTGTIWFSRHEDGLVGAPLENVWKAWKI